MTNTPDGSVYDAIYLAVAERQEIPLVEVRAVLVHRDVPDDSFWYAWDEAVNSAEALFCQVTGRTPQAGEMD